MKKTALLLIMAVAVMSVNAIAQKVIVTPKNPIILDSNHQAQADQSVIMDFEIKTIGLVGTWRLNYIKVEPVESSSEGIVDRDSLKEISIYNLRNFEVSINDGHVVGRKDSVAIYKSMISAFFEFAAGTRVLVKAQFPQGTTHGVLRFKVTLFTQKLDVAQYEQYEFTQTVNIGEKDTLSSVSEFNLSNILVCQNMNERTVTLKNLPYNYTIDVYDLKGQKVYESLNSGSENIIEFRKLPVGMYYIQIHSNNNAILTRKVAI